MLNYKLLTDRENILLLDGRIKYCDYNIIHILKFIYNQYERKIINIRDSYTYKLSSLNSLNISLIDKKKTYKNILSKLENSYNPAMIKELFVLFGGSENDFNTYSKAHNYLNRYIGNINSDLRLVNKLKKSFKSYINQYKAINLFYGSNAKITSYDIKKAKKGEITQNTKECLYFYLIKIKKSNSKNIDINTALNPFMEISQIKSIIEKSIKKSFKVHLENTLKDNTTILYNNLLNKWL